MFIIILLAALFAKIKGYPLKPLLKAYALYPYFIAEVLSLFLQMSIFAGNYTFVQYASIIKTVYLYTLILPIVVYKLYKPGIIGAILIVVGTALNKFVMSQNGGKMPVFASFSKITGYYDETAILTIDNVHVNGDETTKFKFLTDYIDVGYSILSIGDILIHAFVLIVIYMVIKEVNKGIENTNK
jgi:hypothetical protein